MADPVRPSLASDRFYAALARALDETGDVEALLLRLTLRLADAVGPAAAEDAIEDILEVTSICDIDSEPKRPQ